MGLYGPGEDEGDHEQSYDIIHERWRWPGSYTYM